MSILPRIEEALRRLKETKDVCVDVETSGLDWKRCHIVGYVLSFDGGPQDSYYIPVRHAGGGNIDEQADGEAPQTLDGWKGNLHPVEQEVIKHLNTRQLIFGHNIAFDLKFLYRVGHLFDPSYEDTMINAVLINEWEPSFSLDALSKQYGVWQKKTTIYDYLIEKFPEARAAPKQAMGHFWRLAGNDPQAVEYAESDGTVTWQLRHKQHYAILDQELAKVHKIESQLIPVLARMMTRGVKIDMDRLHQVREIVAKKKMDALASLPKDFNSRAPSQVRALMEEAGHTDWPMTPPTKAHPDGQPSFPEAWLSKNPIGQNIVAVRKYSNIESSFILPLLETHIWNGRVHTEYNQLRGDEYGTITGRLSSSNPNLQQVHKRNKELGRLYRSIFIPDDGKVWASVDYSQMEPRLLAYYGRVRVLMQGYLATPSVDAHSAVAKAANIDRDDGKRLNQALITGAGKAKVMAMLGKPLEECEKIYGDYFRALPEIRSIQQRSSGVMKSRGYVKSLLGRRARLRDPSKSYVALNRLLQCGNADCLKLKMVEIDQYLQSEGRSVDMLNNVHDALDFQFEEKNRKIYNECTKIMTKFGEGDVIHLDVPIEVDAGEGPNWAIATYGEE